MQSYTELMDQANALMEQAKQARKLELAGVIDGLKVTIAKYELTAEDLGFAPLKHTRVKKVKDAGADAGAGASTTQGGAAPDGSSKTEDQSDEAGQPA